MFPNQHIQSAPISRMASSVRLNNHISSMPSTPIPNSRTHTNTIPEHLQELQIFKTLNEFEEQLSEFATSIQKFSPRTEIVDQLIKLDNKLHSNVQDIIEHQKFGEQIKNIQTIVDGYDEDNKKILRTLIECRNDLQALPTLETDYDTRQHETTIQATDLLQYAMKLAKFTVAPPTFDAGPNNFIWPAEDALRKGMLATAALCADRLVAVDGATVEIASTIDNEKEEAESVDLRRSSYTSFHANEDNSSNALADLDLFDPDEDDY